MQSPVLRGMLRKDSHRPDVQELIVVALNDAPALDVEIALDPLPKMFVKHVAD